MISGCNTFGCEHDKRVSANKAFIHVVMHTPKLVVGPWASSIAFLLNKCNTETFITKFADYLFLEKKGQRAAIPLT